MSTILDIAPLFSTNVLQPRQGLLARLYLCIVIRKTLLNVILSETKNLNTQTNAHQILHFVQDDNMKNNS